MAKLKYYRYGQRTGEKAKFPKKNLVRFEDGKDDCDKIAAYTALLSDDVVAKSNLVDLNGGDKTMKKEIMNLVKSDYGTFKLNNVSYLRRWTHDALGDKVDRLEIQFCVINNVYFNNCIHEIESRDYDGIIEECAKATEAYFAEVQRKLISNMRNGYH